MPRALKKTVKVTKAAKTVKAKTARRVVKPWTKEDVRTLKAHSKARTPVTKVSKVMKRTVGALRRRAGILGVGDAPNVSTVLLTAAVSTPARGRHSLGDPRVVTSQSGVSSRSPNFSRIASSSARSSAGRACPIEPGREA
jgi:hypothetical protein